MSQFIEMFGDPLKNPKNFAQRKLGDVATLLNGRAYKASELLSSGRYLVLRVGNFFTNTDYYYSDLELEPDKYCDTGDILYSWSATLGAQIWKGGKVIYHYHIWKVLFDENILNKEYFCFMLNVMTDSLKQETHGSTMVHLTKDGMEKKFIAIPPLELQRRFVSIAEQADKSGFDGRKSQFIEMFGNPDDGWKYPTKRLGEVYDIGTGGTPDRKVSGYYEGNIPWVKSTEVNYCELYDTEEHISEQAIKDSNCSLYPPGTILLAMYGQGTTRGRVAQLRTDATVNQAIAAIQVQDETESLFLYSMMKVCYDYVRNHAVGGNQHNLNLKLVSSIPLVVPPKELQQQFVSIAEQTDKSGSVLQYRIAC